MKIVYHEDYLKQTQDYGHPECPERLTSILSFLETNQVNVEVITPESATPEDIRSVHSPEYVEFLREFGQGHMDPDCYVWPHTYDMAMLAAGGATAAAKHTFDRREPSFALLRPPGHHATEHHGGGFCYINNIAVAASSLLKMFEKVAIVDIDVHHGNGTNDIFLSNNRVLYISTHQWEIYPGTGPAEQTGDGPGEGYTVNIPLCAHSGDATFQAVYQNIVIPILQQYRPDMLLVSLGADAHYMEPLASLTLSSAGYMEVISMLSGLAREKCENRIAFFLEGGYNLQALAEVVGGAISAIHGQDISTHYNEALDTNILGNDWMERAIATQRKHWEL